MAIYPPPLQHTLQNTAPTQECFVTVLPLVRVILCANASSPFCILVSVHTFQQTLLPESFQPVAGVPAVDPLPHNYIT